MLLQYVKMQWTETARIWWVEIEMPNGRGRQGKFCVHFSVQRLTDRCHCFQSLLLYTLNSLKHLEIGKQNKEIHFSRSAMLLAGTQPDFLKLLIEI